MVKLPTSVAGQNFLKVQYLRKFPSVCTSSDSAVDPSGSPSITPSPSAENPSKIPGNHGKKSAVNYLHEILVIIPTLHTSSVTSVIAPLSALSIPSVHPSDVELQEIPSKIPITNYGEKYLVEITAKIFNNITLTLQQVKFLEKTPGNFNWGNFSVEFPSGQKIGEIPGF